MDVKITKQMSDLNDLQNKIMSICGDYKGISIAEAALQICNHYGLDETSKIISSLRISALNIDTSEKLNDVLRQCSNFIINSSLIIKDDKTYCPTCNNVIDMSDEYKHCPFCGQNINKKVVIDNESSYTNK